jgi:putative ABC transport system permease protein
MSKCPLTILVFPSNELSAMNSDLDALDRTEAFVFTYNIRRAQLDDEVAGFQDVLNIIMAIMIIALGVSLGAIIMIAYSDRKSEFGILSAIGYSRREIRLLICKEIGILSLVATAAGYALSLLLLVFLNVAVFSSKGTPLTVFTLSGLIFTLLVPVMVFACAIVPIMRRLNKTDLVSVIEGK